MSGTPQLATPAQLQQAVGNARAQVPNAPDADAALALVTEALAGYSARHPEATELDNFQVLRLAIHALDGEGQYWMDQAGLLATDSCGYPVSGGFYDVNSDLSATPVVAAQPAVGELVRQQLLAQWADSYIATGSSDLGLPWRDYLADQA